MTDENLEIDETVPEKSPKEQGEEKLAKMLEQHPELKNYAKFTVNDEGEIVYEYIIDFKDFDISFEDYFFLKNHPDDKNAKWIDEFYEKLNNAVMDWCNESGEYTIDCWQDRYTVRKIDDIEQIHYDALTPEEKSKHDEDELNNRKEYIKGLCSNYINDISWRIERYNTQKELGIATSDTAETYLKILEYMQYLREYDEQSGEWWTEEPKTFEDWKK